jgi:hypothetical protein
MFVCVSKKGSDADGCLKLEFPIKKHRQQILKVPLPWCLGGFPKKRADALRDCFTSKGGDAETVANCNGCHTVAKALGGKK